MSWSARRGRSTCSIAAWPRRPPKLHLAKTWASALLPMCLPTRLSCQEVLLMLHTSACSCARDFSPTPVGEPACGGDSAAASFTGSPSARAQGRWRRQPPTRRARWLPSRPTGARCSAAGLHARRSSSAWHRCDSLTAPRLRPAMCTLTDHPPQTSLITSDSAASSLLGR